VRKVITKAKEAQAVAQQPGTPLMGTMTVCRKTTGKSFHPVQTYVIIPGGQSTAEYQTQWSEFFGPMNVSSISSDMSCLLLTSYMRTEFNASFEYVLDELDEMVEDSTTSLQVKLQENVVELAEQQRRIARMHRQLAAAIANGAVPDQKILAKAISRKTSTAGFSASGTESELLSVRTVEKTMVHEVFHGESWLALVGQCTLALVLGTTYERFRSRGKH
jgi:hypothetical protein